MAAASEAAFLDLYAAHAERLHTYCLRLTGSPDDAADALQDTFTAVFGRLESGAEPIAHPKAYLYATAHNACLRRLGERGRTDVVADVPEAEPAAGPAAGEQAVLTDELRADVRAAHDRLPARQREVLFLREVEEMSYADIGDVMELSPNGAAQLAWRARAGLRSDIRHGALLAVATAGDDCDRARTLLGLHEDGELGAGDEVWLEEHLDECERCSASRGLLLEAGMTYRAVLPIAALPFTAEKAWASAREAHGASGGGSEGGGPQGGAGLHAPGRRAMAGAAAAAVFFGMLVLAQSAQEPPQRAVFASAIPPAGTVATPERTDPSGGRSPAAQDDDEDADTDADAGQESSPAGGAGGDDDEPSPQAPGDDEPQTAASLPGGGQQVVAEIDVEAHVPRPAPPQLQTPATGREPSVVAPADTATPAPAPATPLSSAPSPPPAVPGERPVVTPTGPQTPTEPQPPGEEEPPLPPCDSSRGNNGSSGPGGACDPCPDRDEIDEDDPLNDEGPPVIGAALRVTLRICLPDGARPPQAPRPGAGAASRGR